MNNSEEAWHDGVRASLEEQLVEHIQSYQDDLDSMGDNTPAEFAKLKMQLADLRERFQTLSARHNECPEKKKSKKKQPGTRSALANHMKAQVSLVRVVAMAKKLLRIATHSLVRDTRAGARNGLLTIRTTSVFAAQILLL